MSWDPDDPDHLIVSGMGGASESSDGGATWSQLQVPSGATVVEMSPIGPKTLFAAALDGSSARVWVSRDYGATWREP